MIEDVTEHIQLMLTICDRFGVRAFRPQATRFGAQSMLAHCVRCVLFCASDPVPWIVVRESCEDVEVFSVNGDDKDFDAVL